MKGIHLNRLDHTLENFNISLKSVTEDQRKNHNFRQFFDNFKNHFKLPQSYSKLSAITFFHENNTFVQIKSYFEELQNFVKTGIAGDQRKNRSFRQFSEISKIGSNYLKMARN